MNFVWLASAKKAACARQKKVERAIDGELCSPEWNNVGRNKNEANSFSFE